ncbi:MAG: GNAT family N-acetyltransferase [Actinomycetota bacterium]|nr:GNAT family N-acetyltransferase [Actinomycetota bacterium]
MIGDLRTERLLLRPWDEGARSGFAALAADPRVMRYIGDGTVWTGERADEVFARQLDHWRAHGFGWRSAELADDARWIGFVGLNYVPPEAVEVERPGEVEIGWWLDPSTWGRGLAAEGAAALRDEAFERVGLDRIIGRHQPGNAASGRIMERIGMRFERDAVGRHGDVVRIHALHRSEWIEARTRKGAGLPGPLENGRS